MKKMLKISVLMVMILLVIAPIFPAVAAEFNPNYVISDEDLTNYQSMTAEQIQSFLERKGSYLSRYECEDTDGVVRKAADIIYRIANAYFINPKFILALIQKEQSLVENPYYHERESDPGGERYAGFGRA